MYLAQGEADLHKMLMNHINLDTTSKLEAGEDAS